MFAGRKSTKKSPEKVNALTDAEAQAIKEDALNKKLWEECLEVCRTSGKKVCSRTLILALLSFYLNYIPIYYYWTIFKYFNVTHSEGNIYFSIIHK